METDSLPKAEQKPPKLRWFQYRLRSLLILMLLVAIGMSFLAVEIQNQRKEKAAAEAIEKAGGKVWSLPTWLGKILRDDSLVWVNFVDLTGQSITDDMLTHLERMNQLIGLDLRDTDVSDTGLVHLQGMSQLQGLWLGNTKVTNQGVNKLQQALPNCRVFR
jgi:hypothetical protein